MWCRVGLVRTGVSKERVVSIFRVKKFASEEKSTARGSFSPEDGGDTFLRNVGSHETHTAPHPRRRHSSYLPLCKSQILQRPVRFIFAEILCSVGTVERPQKLIPRDTNVSSFEICFCLSGQTLQDNSKTPWPESASELYRPRDRRLSAKLLPPFADRGCYYVVNVTDPYGRMLGFFFQVAPQLYSRG
jgi:hypothetical protein